MTKFHNVLCQCGWGLLACPEEEIPQHCPVCNFDLWGYADGQEEEEEIAFGHHVFKGDSVLDNCKLCGWEHTHKNHA